METCKKQSLKKSICPARRVLNLLKGKFTLEILSEMVIYIIVVFYVV